MIKTGRKVISFVTVILLVVFSVLPAVSAVSYPEGVTKQQLEATIYKTDTLIETLAGATAEGSVEDIIMPELYKDEVLSSLVVNIYKAMEENAESLSAIGLDISVPSFLKWYHRG